MLIIHFCLGLIKKKNCLRFFMGSNLEVTTDNFKIIVWIYAKLVYLDAAGGTCKQEYGNMIMNRFCDRFRVLKFKNIRSIWRK